MRWTVLEIERSNAFHSLQTGFSTPACPPVTVEEFPESTGNYRVFENLLPCRSAIREPWPKRPGPSGIDENERKCSEMLGKSGFLIRSQPGRCPYSWLPSTTSATPPTVMAVPITSQRLTFSCTDRNIAARMSVKSGLAETMGETTTTSARCNAM